MPKITEYQIISDDDLPTLKMEVGFAIDDGWQPIGGVTVFGGLLLQAVVRAERS